jgi:uncharacterized protein YgbK (DUF1537 family)
VRLLLDEHYSRKIAERLRKRGLDAITVTERPELRGLDDEALLVWCVQARRVLLTNNVARLATCAAQFAESGRKHYGLIFTSDRTMPRARETIGLYIKALVRLMRAEPADDALVDQTRWLVGWLVG